MGNKIESRSSVAYCSFLCCDHKSILPLYAHHVRLEKENSKYSLLQRLHHWQISGISCAFVDKSPLKVVLGITLLAIFLVKRKQIKEGVRN